jgi:MYXO-CTERM domain-containing protein
MKRTVLGGLIALALLLAVSGLFGGNAGSLSPAFAQDTTPVATVVATVAAPVQQTQPVQQTEDNNDFPWGLLGLLGLAGLAGLRRQPEREHVTPVVGVYDTPKR